MQRRERIKIVFIFVWPDVFYPTPTPIVRIQLVGAHNLKSVLHEIKRGKNLFWYFGTRPLRFISCSMVQRKVHNFCVYTFFRFTF